MARTEVSSLFGDIDGQVRLAIKMGWRVESEAFLPPKDDPARKWAATWYWYYGSTIGVCRIPHWITRWLEENKLFDRFEEMLDAYRTDESLRIAILKYLFLRTEMAKQGQIKQFDCGNILTARRLAHLFEMGGEQVDVSGQLLSIGVY